MKRALLPVLLLLLAVLLCGCSGQDAGTVSLGESNGAMDLKYAHEFSVEDYPEGYALITIGQDQRILVVPQGKPVPTGLEKGILVLKQPLTAWYVASSSAMDLLRGLQALDTVSMTATRGADWSIPDIRERVENGPIAYAGKYSTPDYELILSRGCGLALENTMLYHSPQVREQLERLGIPVVIERSSYENHPLGRLEWIRLYGVLLGCREKADAVFEESVRLLEQIEEEDATGKTVAFFYISSNGYVNIRKPGDYISAMIRLAGGRYVFEETPGEEENALSTMNIDLESFYETAVRADVLIYNGTVSGSPETMDQLLEKWPALADFSAVQAGQVFCTEQNVFQETTGAAEMIRDLHLILTEQEGEPLRYFYQIKP